MSALKPQLRDKRTQNQWVMRALSLAILISPHARALKVLKLAVGLGPRKLMLTLLAVFVGFMVVTSLLTALLYLFFGGAFGALVVFFLLITGQSLPVSGLPQFPIESGAKLPPSSGGPMASLGSSSTTSRTITPPGSLGDVERIVLEMPDEIPSQFRLYLARAQVEQGLRWQRGAALVQSESSWQPNLTSSAGAYGYCQFQRATLESPQVGGTWAIADTPECIHFMAIYLMTDELGGRTDPLCAIYYYKGGAYRQPRCNDEVKETDPDLIRHKALVAHFESVTKQLPAVPSRPMCQIGPASSQGFHWPVIIGFSTVTTEYGVPSLVEASHTGIDLAGTLRSSVCAARDGEVIASTSAPFIPGHGCNGYGLYIVLRHSGGYSSLYGHLDELKVVNGDRVLAGQEIGKLGSSGCSTGPHVHFTVLLNGNLISPRTVLPAQIG